MFILRCKDGWGVCAARHACLSSRLAMKCAFNDRTNLLAQLEITTSRFFIVSGVIFWCCVWGNPGRRVGDRTARPLKARVSVGLGAREARSPSDAGLLYPDARRARFRGRLADRL